LKTNREKRKEKALNKAKAEIEEKVAHFARVGLKKIYFDPDMKKKNLRIVIPANAGIF
jgi:hypothetical protein